MPSAGSSEEDLRSSPVDSTPACEAGSESWLSIASLEGNGGGGGAVEGIEGLEGEGRRLARLAAFLSSWRFKTISSAFSWALISRSARFLAATAASAALLMASLSVVLANFPYFACASAFSVGDTAVLSNSCSLGILFTT